MCGRYNITKKLVTLEKELDLQTIHRELFDGLVNIAPGDLAPIITHQQEEVQFFQFGMTPFWAKKKMYLFNARAEGDFNKENDKNYNGNKGILQKPAFRKPIRSQRCLVIANSFIEGDEKEKLNKPFLIFRKDFRSFTMGGIWDEWVDKNTGEIIHSFAIITTASNSITAEVGHHRAPLIISPEDRKAWLNPDTDLNQITSLLQPFDGDDYNAFPISAEIKNPRNKDIHTLLPTGKALRKQKIMDSQEEIELLGMDESRAKNKKEKEE